MKKDEIKNGLHLTRSHLGKTLRLIVVSDGKCWLCGLPKCLWPTYYFLEVNDYVSPILIPLKEGYND